MIGRKRREGTPAIDWDGRRDGIDEIARRLDELLRAMGEAPAASQSGRGVRTGTLEAARQVWDARGERERIFGSTLAPDPAWDIFLHLFITSCERGEATPVSVSAATGVAVPTVLRCIAHLAEARLVARQPHPFDEETTYLTLTDRAVGMMSEYLHRTARLSGAADA